MLCEITADYYKILNELKEFNAHLQNYTTMLEVEVDSLNSIIEIMKRSCIYKNKLYEDGVIEILALKKQNLLLNQKNELLESTNKHLVDQNISFLLEMNTK
jgi:hypothetical protein